MIENLQNRVTTLLERILGNTLGAETYDLPRSQIEGWDSLIHMEIIFACEDEFDIQLDAEEIAKIQTINDLIKIFSGKLT
jgi:acyl carrier protein